ncbi:MAG: hypothetical protein HY810_03105 [Candidatus Omnitrophica bacterium]|nr:hypothetical protein [Candidatus Omnitrophota bacterium]
MDKDEIFLTLKYIVIGIAIIAAFIIFYPKCKAFNENITKKIKEFVSELLEGTIKAVKVAPQAREKFITAEVHDSEKIFTAKFLTGIAEPDFAKAFYSGESLLKIVPERIDIKRRLAFLYFFSGDLIKAEEYYCSILDTVPKRKRTFESLKSNKDYYTYKRLFLEMSALCCEKSDFDGMSDYYKQYLRICHRKDVFAQMSENALEQQEVEISVYSNLAGEGLCSYIESLEGLKQLDSKYPNNVRIAFLLGFNTFEFYNLLLSEWKDTYKHLLIESKMYFEKAAQIDPEYEQQTILKNLGIIKKVLNEPGPDIKQ